MSALEMMAAIAITTGRVIAVVMVARVSTSPQRYSWPQVLLVLVLAMLVFLPTSFR